MADPVDDLLPLLGINHHNNEDSDSESSNGTSEDTSSGTDEELDEGAIEVDVPTDDEQRDRGDGEVQEEACPRRWFKKSDKKKKSKRKSSEGDKEQVIINFDKSLPATHSYLGNDLEDLRGRTVLEENSIVTLPMLLMPNIVLVPGQVIPLQLYVPRIVAMVRRAADTDKTFGVLNVRYSDSDTGQVSDIGCTAEIFSMKDEEDELSGIAMVRAKARGRQRFRVMDSLITEITGDVRAKVMILPELTCSHVLEGAQLPSLRRFLIPPSEESDDMMLKTAVDRQGQILASVDMRPKRPFNKLFAAHFTWWPPWVYKAYDIDWLSEQIGVALKSWCSTNLPKDPVELSYWVAHNLLVDDKTRLLLLSLDSVVQRLRYGLSIIKKSGVTLCCKSCRRRISNKKEVFSMSQEGPLGAFVNPGGYVHEMFTVLSVNTVSYIGGSSTEHSWFPGYAWTIIQCKSCHSHLGWMFTGTKRSLSPHKFWGLCRSAISTVFSEGGGDDEDSADEPVYIV